MKKNILIIAAALALSACGGNGGNQNAENADSSAVETQTEPQVLFHYVEPQEEIAKIIWEKIQDTYPVIKKEVAAAKKWKMDEELGRYYNGASQKERYPQKTRMVFNNVIDGAEGSWEDLCYYKLQCYQNNDGSWTAALLDTKTLNTFRYKDGVLTDNTATTDIPKVQTQPLIKNINDDYGDCAVVFDTIGFTMLNDDFWPIRYNWNGEKFIKDPNSVVLANMINQYGTIGGECSLFYIGGEPSMKGYSVAEDLKLENNILTQGGEKMAELEIEDQKLSAITFYSPKIGFAQRWTSTNDCWGTSSARIITSLPLAVGYPIKNALDKAGYDPDYTSEKKDDYYVLTRLTNRDKYNKRDIMISFYAKDENSKIEKIRLFSVPLKITLESELEEKDNLDETFMEIWTKLKDQYKITDALGEFHNTWTNKNGFSARFYDKGNFTQQSVNEPIEWNLKCYIFENSEGTYKVYTQKEVDNEYRIKEDERKGLVREFAEYIYENGKLTQVAVEIPQSKVTDYKANAYDKTLILPEKEVKSNPQTLISSIPLPECCSGSSIELTEYGFDLRAASTKYPNYGTEAWDEGEKHWIYNFVVHYDWDDENFTLADRLW